VGEGVGLLSRLAKLSLEYGAGEAGPDSLVIKMDVTSEVNRAIADSLDSYEHEVGFYRDIGPSTNVRTPASYYGHYRASDGRAVMLMEDLSAYRPGNQVAGASLADVQAAVTAVAALHAQYWQGNDAPALPDWLPTLGASNIAGAFKGFVEPFVANVLRDWADELSGPARDSFAGMTQWSALADRMSQPPTTLIHSDTRFDNFMFGPDSSEGPVMLDWQFCAEGRGPWDVSMLLVENLDPELPRAHEADLLHQYHDALIAGGVLGYSFDDCMADYRMGVLTSLRVAALAGNPEIDLGNERGQELARTMLRRAASALTDHRCDQLLPLS
jgi:hypothetical protein